MVRQPTTLTPKVPQGNPEATCPCTNLDSKYLATPPMKLPDPTKRSVFSITIKKLLDSKTRESPPGKILPYSFYPVKTGQFPVACTQATPPSSTMAKAASPPAGILRKTKKPFAGGCFSSQENVCLSQKSPTWRYFHLLKHRKTDATDFRFSHGPYHPVTKIRYYP